MANISCYKRCNIVKCRTNHAYFLPCITEQSANTHLRSSLFVTLGRAQVYKLSTDSTAVANIVSRNTL